MVQDTQVSYSHQCTHLPVALMPAITARQSMSHRQPIPETFCTTTQQDNTLQQYAIHTTVQQMALYNNTVQQPDLQDTNTLVSQRLASSG